MAVAAVSLLSALAPGGPVVSVAAVQSAVTRSDDDAALQAQIVAKEREGLDTLKTGDLAHFGDLTAEDAVFVDAQGPATKAEVLEHTAGFRLTDYTIEDVRFVRAGENAGLIAYKITEKGNSHGHDFAVQVYVSSMWAKRDGKWVCLFSQETAMRHPGLPPETAAPASSQKQ
jgi:ketosteroid isomerase-like protein